MANDLLPATNNQPQLATNSNQPLPSTEMTRQPLPSTTMTNDPLSDTTTNQPLPDTTSNQPLTAAATTSQTPPATATEQPFSSTRPATATRPATSMTGSAMLDQHLQAISNQRKRALESQLWQTEEMLKQIFVELKT